MQKYNIAVSEVIGKSILAIWETVHPPDPNYGDLEYRDVFVVLTGGQTIWLTESSSPPLLTSVDINQVLAKIPVEISYAANRPIIDVLDSELLPFATIRLEPNRLVQVNIRYPHVMGCVFGEIGVECFYQEEDFWSWSPRNGPA